MIFYICARFVYHPKIFRYKETPELNLLGAIQSNREFTGSIFGAIFGLLPNLHFWADYSVPQRCFQEA